MCLSLIVLHFTSPNSQFEIRRQNSIETTDFKTNSLWSLSRPPNLPHYGLKWPDLYRALIANRYQIRQFLYGKLLLYRFFKYFNSSDKECII